MNSSEETKGDEMNLREAEKGNEINLREEIKGNKIYCEYKHFKGNTFETNINSINDLLLGRAQRISNTQFLYVDEKDGKNYISANYFIIRRKSKDDKEGNKGKEIKICYPHNFLYLIFFEDNKFFYINKNNNLVIFKLEGNNVKKYVFTQKKEIKDPKNSKKDANLKKNDEKNDKNEIKEKNINISEDTIKIKENDKIPSEDIIGNKKGKDKDKLNNINGKKAKKKGKDKDTSNKGNEKDKEFQYEKKEESTIIIENDEELKKKIELYKNKDSNLNQKYELLCDILKNFLKEELNIDKPKTLIKIMKINFDGIENCEIKYCTLQLDCTGIIQEQLNVQKGIMSFKKGIRDLKTFIENKRNKNIIDNTKIDNTFKTPIIFKNFEEEFIPPKKAFICEIKSGFDIETLKTQIKQRIDIVNDCLFVNDKPSHYIGIVNINDRNVDKLYNIKDSLDKDFILEERIIILSTINYLYCDIDTSYQVHTDYILFKKLNNMDKEIKGSFYTVFKLIFTLFFILFILLFFLNNKMDNRMDQRFNDINNRMDQRFNELYQIIIDAKKNDNMLLNTKKTFQSKDNNIPGDVCYPNEL